ncbi:MAG TPA: MarR family transcriptional regulator [Longimicrobiaceae bacterium]|jgi:DNA-binding MarR family transcriptional regulator|nr:MarR family transcriptional regulator [Longimicrobiaceae bacterium]
MGDAFPTRFAVPEESPGFVLWRATNAWQRRIREALEPTGLTHVQLVLLASLVWMTRGGYAVTQADLARQAATDVMMTSQVLRALEMRGLLVRSPHPTDARARALRPTDEGAALATRAIPLVEHADAEFFAAAGDDLPAVIRALQAMSASAG